MRSDVRSAIKYGLAVAVPTAVVYDYVPMEVGLPSPLIMLEVVGTQRTVQSFQGAQRRHLLTIHLFVALADASYTESNSQSDLDSLEEAIGAWLAANRVAPAWKSLEAGQTMADLVTVGGDIRRHEAIPLTILEV